MMHTEHGNTPSFTLAVYINHWKSGIEEYDKNCKKNKPMRCGNKACTT